MSTPADQIESVLEEYNQDTRALIDQLYEIAWYMRGSISREEVFVLSYGERKKIMSLIKDNIERTKKSGMPLL